jgi:hypothetical protein
LGAGATWQTAGQDAAGIVLPTEAGHEVLAEHCWKATELKLQYTHPIAAKVELVHCWQLTAASQVNGQVPPVVILLV